MRKLFNTLCALGVLCSCDSFLNVESQDEVIPETTQAFSELLWGEGYPQEGELMDAVVTYLSDELTGRAPLEHSESALLYQNFYLWQPAAFELALEQEDAIGYSQTDGMNCWEAYYKRILGCNIALAYADDSEGTEEEKVRLRGEAYVLRAYYYFQLVNYYGWPYNDKETNPNDNPGVPLILVPDLVEERTARHSVAEVYEQIEKDLETGIELLEKEGRVRSVFRMNYLAAHLIASRIYLYVEDWDKALEHAQVVMENSALVDLTGEEPSIKQLERGNEEILWMYGASRNWYSLGGDANDSYLPSDDLMKLFVLEEPLEDRRLTYCFDSITNLDETLAGYKVVKWNRYNSSFGQAFRSAEAWLNATEALLMKYKEGDQVSGEEGLALLNELRSKRIYAGEGNVLEDIPMQAADVLLNLYKEERRKELCFEGQRWFDLRRYGMPRIEKVWCVNEQQNETYALEERDLMYVLAIPSEAMDRNDKLEQNPGASQGTRMPL